MRGMIARGLIAALLALAPGLALGQSSLLQGGSWTAGHAPMYSAPGGSQPIVLDSGSAAGGVSGVGLSELGLTVRGTGTAPFANAGTGPLFTNFCNYDGPTTGAYHYLCFSPNAGGGGLIAYGAGGGASQLPLSLSINGATYQFPFALTGVVGPAVTVANDVACWNNLVGTLLKDCGAFPVNAGTQNQIAWYATTGSVVSGLGTSASGVLVTSAGSVPSISTTLPGSLTIPSPTLTGTVGGGNVIPYSVLAQAPANTFLGNNTGSPANVISLTAGQAGAVLCPPSRTTLTTGTGATYTVPTCNSVRATNLTIRMNGGAGGGGAQATSGAVGTTTSFDTLTTNGGSGGAGGGSMAVAPGGTASGCDINIAGSAGQGPSNTLSVAAAGGQGGTSPFGGAGGGGASGVAGTAAGTNSGSGGGGGGSAGGAYSAGGGGAGGYCEKLLLSPAASYVYTVGTGGSGGTGAPVGGNGAAGIIDIIARWQ